MTMTIYTKIKIKIKRFFSYFIIFYKKWLFYIRLWLLMLILRKEKSLAFTFCLAYFDRSRKSDLGFCQTLSLFYILFLIIYFFRWEKILFIIFTPLTYPNPILIIYYNNTNHYHSTATQKKIPYIYHRYTAF